MRIRGGGALTNAWGGSLNALAGGAAREWAAGRLIKR